MTRLLQLRLATLAVAGAVLLALIGTGGMPAAAQGASQHSLVLDPSFVHSGAASFHDNKIGDNFVSCDDDAPLPVGYWHATAYDPLGDTFHNCVYESAVRFDLGSIHQYSGAVVTQARLSYDDDIALLRRPDWSPAGDPHDLNDDAVWNSCTAQVGVPNDDWRGETGLIPYSPDETIDRLDRTTWDVTNQVRHWYYDPDYLNNGLMLLGYDEGTNFSNNAACVSYLSNVKLTVDFVSNDPTPVTIDIDKMRRALATPTPVTIDVSKMHPISVSTPSSVVGVGPALPDLTVSSVDTVSYLKSGLGQVCGADRGTTFTVHVKNVGRVASPDSALVALAVDGTPKGTARVDIIPAGVERTVTIDGVVLSAGTHRFTVTVNDGQTFAESDASNNSFTNDQLSCYQ